MKLRKRLDKNKIESLGEFNLRAAGEVMLDLGEKLKREFLGLSQSCKQ
jgi:hypothetical protein